MPDVDPPADGEDLRSSAALQVLGFHVSTASSQTPDAAMLRLDRTDGPVTPAWTRHQILSNLRPRSSQVLYCQPEATWGAFPTDRSRQEQPSGSGTMSGRTEVGRDAAETDRALGAPDLWQDWV